MASAPTAGIIDFHTHFFSRTFFETLAAQSPQPGTPEERLAAVCEKTGIELPARELEAHLDRWDGELAANAVDHIVSFASVPEEIPVLAEAAQARDFLTPFAICNPRAPDVAAKVRGLFESKGFRGILVFPAMHHYRMNGPAAADVLSVLQDHGGFIVAHCGLLKVTLRDLLDLPRPQDLAYANPLDLIPAANAFPDVKFIIPHFGAGFFRETLMAGSMCENVYVDTSSSNSWTATQSPTISLEDVFRAALGVFGTERILFGSDSCTFPRGWRQDLLQAQWDALDACGLAGDEKMTIFRGNAARLLGIG